MLAEAHSHRATVLVIDDDRIIRMVVREALADSGLHVLEAGTAAEGMEIAVEQSPDLIILDVMLPRVDGLALLSELRARGVHAQVLVFSATGASNADRAIALGASGYLAKPFELSELRRCVNDLLDGRASA